MMKTIVTLIAIISGAFAMQSLFANDCPADPKFADCDYCIESCQALTGYSAGDAVCLKADIEQTVDTRCLLLNSDGIVLDCKGHRITRAVEPYYNDTAIVVNSPVDFATVRDCEADGWHYGLLVYGNDGWFEYNKFFDNNIGIALYNASDIERHASGNEISFNNTSGNKMDGIWLYKNADGNKIHDNVSHENEGYGVYCESSGGVIPDDNKFYDNQVNQNWKSGFRLRGCDADYVIYNTANRNGQHGLYLDSDTDGVQIFRNRFNRNGWDTSCAPFCDDWYGIYQDVSSTNNFDDPSFDYNPSNVCKNNDAGPSYDGDYCK